MTVEAKMGEAIRAFLDAHPQYGEAKLRLYNSEGGLSCDHTFNQRQPAPEVDRDGPREVSP